MIPKKLAGVWTRLVILPSTTQRATSPRIQLGVSESWSSKAPEEASVHSLIQMSCQARATALAAKATKVIGVQRPQSLKKEVTRVHELC